MNMNSALTTAEFVRSVLEFHPQLAVFDCDGTLWARDAGASFFEWELTRGLVSGETVRWDRARYADYLAGNGSEDDMWAELVTLNCVIAEVEVIGSYAQFFA